MTRQRSTRGGAHPFSIKERNILSVSSTLLGPGRVNDSAYDDMRLWGDSGMKLRALRSLRSGDYFIDRKKKIELAGGSGRLWKEMDGREWQPLTEGGHEPVTAG